MNPNRSKVELNSLNTGKLGLEQSKLSDLLDKAAFAYLTYALAKKGGDRPLRPISLKNLQLIQSRVNAIRRVLGLKPVCVMQHLRIQLRKIRKGDV